MLTQSLLETAQNGEVVDVKDSEYGSKFVVRGKVETPNGKVIALETVWIIEKGQTRPRLVTAYPV